MYSYNVEIQITPENAKRIEKFGVQFGFDLHEARQVLVNQEITDTKQLIQLLGAQAAARIYDKIEKDRQE